MDPHSMAFQLAWKFLLGGGIVAVVTYLSEIDRPLLSGLFIVFPAITLTSYFLIGHSQGVEQMRAAIPSSFLAILGYLVLLPVMYAATYRFDVLGTLAVSFLAWLAVTLILLKLFL